MVHLQESEQKPRGQILCPVMLAKTPIHRMQIMSADGKQKKRNEMVHNICCTFELVVFVVLNVIKCHAHGFPFLICSESKCEKCSEVMDIAETVRSGVVLPNFSALARVETNKV